MNHLSVTIFCAVLLLGPIEQLRAEEKTVEDGLFELARENGADVYLDATSVNIQAPAAWPVEPGNTLNLFNRWAQRHKLSMAKKKDDFFFWAEPDVEKVAADLLAGEGLHSERVLPTQFDFYLSTSRLLQQKPQLREMLSKPVPLAELPAEIANPVSALLVAFELGDYPSQSLYTRIFEDDFWNSSQMRVDSLDPDYKNPRDKDWPFPLQTILQDQQPRLSVEYTPLRLVVSRESVEVLRRAEDQTLKTKEGNTARRTLELRNLNANETDLRLIETRKPNQTAAERLVEWRPSKTAPEIPWQKIEDPAQIEQALIRLRETLLRPGLGEKSRQGLAKYATPGTQLPDEEALYKEISCELRRQPLPEFIAELQKQSGVKLALQGMPEQNITPDEIAKLLVTTRVVKKPVGAVLQNLDRLFGIVWKQRAPGSYVGQVRSRGDWRTRLLQFGDLGYYRSGNYGGPVLEARQQSINKMVRKVSDSIRATNQKLPATVKFIDLPAPLQKEIRQEAEARARYLTVGRQIRAIEALRGQVSVQLIPDSVQFRIYFDGEPGLLIPPVRPEGIIPPSLFKPTNRVVGNPPVNR
jgi:hypothetical protein